MNSCSTKYIGNVSSDKNRRQHQHERVFSPDGCCPTICAGEALGRYLIMESPNNNINIAGHLFVKGWHRKACEVLSPNGISTCIHCQSNNLLQKIIQFDMEKNYITNLPNELVGKKFRIRKLTPRECFRLMGVAETDIDKLIEARKVDDDVKQMQNEHTSVKRVLSNSSLYKLAGNSIVAGGNYVDCNGNVDGVLYNLFRKMFIDTENESQQLTLF